ncbi:glycosyltransferase [Ruania alkalisoli]|uniref:Glycosyltransferase n=2 Tax=Ruania alkalisoli TaxID=2779775 RepID=A0A7M1SYY0_9MICO|nr:glycosyltransferase [Ruania alkalisoli]
MLVSRIFAPEPSAATFRLGALVRALAGAGARVEVVTAEAPDGAGSLGLVRPAEDGASGGSGARPGESGAWDARGGTGAAPAIPARVRRAPVLRDPSGYVRGYLPYLSFDVPLLWRLLRGSRPDVYVVEPPPTTGAVVRVIAALRGRSYVYYAADVWSDASASTGAPKVVVRLVRALESWVLRGAAVVLSVNEGVTERVRELGARQVVTVGNGVDTDVFTPGEASPADASPPADATLPTDASSPTGANPSADATPSARPTRSNPVASCESRSGYPERDSRGERGFQRASEIPDGPFLLYAGTASEWQGAEVFAEAMPRVLEEFPDAQVVFLGQGSSWDRLSMLAAGLPEGAITLHDPVSAAESAVWQRRASAALVSLRPGIGYDFAMPTKMFAALACGTPVIFAGPVTSPAARLVESECLGWVTDHDAGEVAEAMIAALRAADESVAETAAESEGDRLVAWVREHRSLAAVGERAADAVLSAVTSRG